MSRRQPCINTRHREDTAGVGSARFEVPVSYVSPNAISNFLSWSKEKKQKQNKNPLNPSECSHHLRLAGDSSPPRRPAALVITADLLSPVPAQVAFPRSVTRKRKRRSCLTGRIRSPITPPRPFVSYGRTQPPWRFLFCCRMIKHSTSSAKSWRERDGWSSQISEAF